jgi:5'-nucleotidase
MQLTGAGRLGFSALGHVIWTLCAVLLTATQAGALDILITNDDGVESSTIHALYQVLKADGHHVIISSETQDNSGRGGAVDFFRPIGPLKQNSRADGVKAGAPGIGKLPGFDDVYYIDGTPVAATVYGLDIAAVKTWGRAPDLIISGPNYGNNTGLINNSSGTVNAALIGINRGVPSIAVSAANPARYKSYANLAPTDPEYEIARVMSGIVNALDAKRSSANAPLLPAGTALNVNFPKFAPGTAAKLRIVLGQEGLASQAMPVFSEDLSTDPTAIKFGVKLSAQPGVSIEPATMDTDPKSEQNIIDGGAIAISVLKGNHAADEAHTKTVGKLLKSILSRLGAHG